MYTEDTAKKILFSPIKSGADHLCILSAHATPAMASWLLKSYDEQDISDVSIELIIGTAVNEGISNAYHEGFKKLHGNRYSNNSGNFSCSYIYTQPASLDNLYIWLRNDTPFCAFSGELEFTQNSFLRNRSGTVTEISASDAYTNFETAVQRSAYCTFSEIEEYIIIYESPLSNSPHGNNSKSISAVSLSLLTSKDGETGKRSGLNWGQRSKRNKNEAYIPLPSKIAKSGFFPLNKQHFIALTDDHCALLLRVEQQNDKAITTPASNAQLGEYFRKRLNLNNGAFIHAEDLVAYGRTDVTFYKIDDEQFYMDFSVNKEYNNGR